jgi:hypothetical protein
MAEQRNRRGMYQMKLKRGKGRAARLAAPDDAIRIRETAIQTSLSIHQITRKCHPDCLFACGIDPLLHQSVIHLSVPNYFNRADVPKYSTLIPLDPPDSKTHEQGANDKKHQSAMS